jgi:MarR family transcriptional regulator, organic hydroperoxide resistance regulator
MNEMTPCCAVVPVGPSACAASSFHANYSAQSNSVQVDGTMVDMSHRSRTTSTDLTESGTPPVAAGDDPVAPTVFPVDQGDVLRLDVQLCFALHAAVRAYDAVYRRVLAGTGLTYTQYLVMLVLWEHNSVSIKELGQLLRLDSGTLSPLLKRMQSAGFVCKERNVLDERSVTISLTAAGSALRDRAVDVPLTMAKATGLTFDQLTDMRSRLNDLTGALNRAEEDAAAHA